MASNYDHTAWFYDATSKLVFCNTIRNAQVSLLKYIPQHSHVLIVGGGTGWILDEITRLYPAGLNITYVEISANMTALSRKRSTGSNNIVFITDTIEHVNINQPVDVLITPFLFDNFTPGQLPGLFKHMHKMLKPGGLWLFNDFQIAGKWWHPVFASTMYTFFKIFKAVEASKLPDTLRVFKEYGYEPLFKKTFYGDFIVSAAFRKSVDQ